MSNSVSPAELIQYLDDNFVEPVLIKIFNKVDHAIDFSKGYICLGTVEYYRKKYEQDGRGDSGDSIATFPIVFGISDKNSPSTIHNVYATQTNILTALIYCMMEYDHSISSKKKVIDYFKQKENLGSYLCVIKNREHFNQQLNNLTFISMIDGDRFIPVIRLPYVCGRVEYVDRPDSMGFQKKSISKYVLQQEYRYAFNFYAKGLTQSQKGQLKSTCLFNIGESIECDIFQVESMTL